MHNSFVWKKYNAHEDKIAIQIEKVVACKHLFRISGHCKTAVSVKAPLETLQSSIEQTNRLIMPLVEPCCYIQNSRAITTTRLQFGIEEITHFNKQFSARNVF